MERAGARLKGRGLKRGAAARKARGVTLIELAVSVAIATILITMAWAGLRSLPKVAKLSSAMVEISSEMTQARGRATGKLVRTAVLLSATQGEIRYWVLEDPGLTLDDALRGGMSWPVINDGDGVRPPADRVTTGGNTYAVVSRGKLSGDLALAPEGHKGLVKNEAHPGCAGAEGERYVAAAIGGSTNAGYFPPPYCRVPAQTGCTFCSQDGGATRGFVLFEPDGRVRLFDARGEESPAKAGSLALYVPSIGESRGATVALTSTGMIRTFRGKR